MDSIRDGAQAPIAARERAERLLDDLALQEGSDTARLRAVLSDLCAGHAELETQNSKLRIAKADADAALARQARAECELRESEGRLRQFVDLAPAPLAMFDRDMRYLAVSRRWLSSYGLEGRDIIGLSHYDVFPEITGEWKAFHRRGLEGETLSRDEDRFVRQNGEVEWKRWELKPWRTPEGEVGGIVLFSEDVTENRRIREELNGINAHLERIVEARTRESLASREQLARLNRALRLIHACDDMLIHASAEDALLANICRNIVETGGYLMAWVGYAEQDAGKTVRPVAESGFEEGYLASVRVTWDDTALGHGPTGTAIRTRTAQVNQNCVDNPIMTPWREAALKRGYQASIALPLVENGAAFGALTIYAREPFAFNAAEVDLLEKLANDLSFGIIALRTAAGRAAAEESLYKSEERYRAVIETSADGFYVVDREGRLLEVNDAYVRMSGYAREELLGMSIFDLDAVESPRQTAAHLDQLFQNRHGRFETTHRRKDGQVWPVEIATNYWPHVGHLFVFATDITERVGYKSQLEHQATRDALTGLANRALFHDRIEQGIRQSVRSGRSVALLFIDLDGFKAVNDTLGHQRGDGLLQEVAGRLLHCVRDTDTVARLGGDEFVVILPELEDMSVIERLCASILETVARPCHLGTDRAYVTASIGIAAFPADAPDADTLLVHAEQAMYASKGEGRSRFSYFTPEMQRTAQEQFQLARDLHTALAANQFMLHFQPIVHLASGQVIKAEALLRWRHPVRGMVSPATFIPIAERSAVINEIGDWVFREAIAYARRWSDLTGRPFKIGVNMSPVQFMRNEPGPSCAELLRKAGLPGESIIVELTEGVLVKDRPEVRERLLKFRDAGIEVAIDDFGTGYSSLSYLKKFHIDYLKIDQSFVQNLAPGSSDLVLSKAIIAMAHELGLRVIAEGIETPGQRDLLIAAGCDFGQGYLFARPMPPEQLEALLAPR